MSYRTLGLFRDAEVYPIYDPKNQPAPFIFPLPDFSGAGHDFSGMTFDEYVDFVASSYKSPSAGLYLFNFIYQNEYTAAFGYVPDYSEVIFVHEQDFVAGGGTCL